MKIVTSEQMVEIEQVDYRAGLSEEQFMEAAGREIASRTANFAEERGCKKEATLLCGKGNNSGDGYAAGTHLVKKGFRVWAIQMIPLEETSPLCRKNAERFKRAGGTIMGRDSPLRGILVDGLFGTGFKGVVKDPYATLIQRANCSGLPILAIDIPSGLNGSNGLTEGEAILATETLFLGLPKRGFFLQQGWNAVGQLQPIDFGLSDQALATAPGAFELLTKRRAASLLPPILRTRHKYQVGAVLGIAGSMAGAAFLASLAALRGGAGIVKLLYPKEQETQYSHSPYELIAIPYDQSQPKDILARLEQAKALFIGPGLGQTTETLTLLKTLLPSLTLPCVLDADALNLIAAEKLSLPAEALLTPHTGEMARLLGQKSLSPMTEDRLAACQQFAENNRIHLLLKGGPTFLFCPDKSITVSPYGSPGMATAGSGDLLTGLLAALLAQGLPPQKAALIGCYIHGCSGELAVKEQTAYALIASDLLNFFGASFRTLCSNSR